MDKSSEQFYPDLYPHKSYIRNDTYAPKKYYLDERGRLVAPNGTRYRLPSGPPEGRRPFQLDRSQTEKHAAKPYIPPWYGQKNVTRDSLFPEQQDANKLSDLPFGRGVVNRPDLGLNKFSNLTAVSKIEPIKISTPQSINLPISIDLQPGLLQSVDWNIVLLTLILSSISFICNVTLLVFLSWKVCRIKSHRKSIPPSMHLMELNSQSWHNPHCEAHSNQSNRTDRELPSQTASVAKCQCVFEIAGNSSLPRHPIGFTGTELHQLPPNCCSNRTARSNHQFKYNLKQKHRVDGPPDASHVYQHHHHHHHHHLPNHRRARNRVPNSWIDNPNVGWLGRFNQFEKGSSSGGSWQMIASDGVISESTADEAESTAESTNNSDVPYDPNRARSVRRKVTQCRRPKKSKTISNTISDSNLNQLSHLTNTTDQNLMNDSVGAGRLDEQFADRDKDSGSRLYKESWTHQPVTACRQNRYVCYTLGIHLGVLGAVLSFVQILAICIALNHRIRFPNPSPDHIVPTTGIVCLISNSLAADTMLCARLYLVIAFVIVGLSSLYINWIRYLARNFNWMCDLQLVRFCFFTNNFNCLEQTSVRQTIRHQQNFAFIALIHSLPWASAAGTALLIAFSFFTKQTDMELNDLAHVNKPNINILFDGLNSLLSCSLKNYQMNSNVKSDSNDVNLSQRISTSGSQSHLTFKSTTRPNTIQLQWIYPFLLIIIPICLQLLFLLIYFSFVYQIRHRIRSISTSLRSFIAHKPLIILLLLVFVESLSSGIPVMKNFFPTIYSDQSKTIQNILSRVIIVHLLIDPWLIGFTVQLIFKNSQPDLEYTNLEHHSNRKLSQTMVTSTKDHDSLTDRKPPGDLVPIPNMTVEDNLHNLKSENSMNIFKCFPIPNQTSISENNGQSIGNRNFQPLLMSCLPTSGIFVSTLNPNSSSHTNPDFKSYRGINAPGFLYPLADPNLKISSPLNSGIYHTNFQDLNFESTLKTEPDLNLSRPMEPPSIIPFSIRNPNLTQTDDLHEESGTLSRTVQDMYPQLCQHHQRLLEQQQQQQQQNQQPSTPQQLSTNTINRRSRNFGSVPRFNQSPASFSQSTTSVKMTQDIKCVENSAMIRNNANNTDDSAETPATTTSTLTSTALESSTNCFHRPLSGKSTATAAVMAAAAAAVAAQAGSLPRALSHTTSPSSDSTTNLETFPTDSVCPRPNSPQCDIVLRNPDLNDVVKKRLSNHENGESNQISTE